MTYVFLANGFEIIEAMIPVDVLRRAGEEVITVSINATKEVVSSNGVTVIADTLFTENDYKTADLLLLPGGMPGAENLSNHSALCQELIERNQKGGLIAAICASPAVVLSKLGILKDKKATCYPGFETQLSDANYRPELVVIDQNIVTGEGPAAAFPFAFALAQKLKGNATTSAVEEGMRYKHLMEEK